MPRPKLCRHVTGRPQADYFKPRGIPMRELQEVSLSMEGFEALRLADLEGLTSIESARHMQVSRHTFGRILTEARRTVAEAIVTGKALSIEGQAYGNTDRHPCSGRGRCHKHREKPMAIVAISSEGPELDDMVDPRFGRAGGFVIVDTATMTTSYLDNGASQTMAQGAGIETAERMSEAGVEVVLSGYVGPKAFEALEAAGIKICQDVDGMTVRQALEKFMAGEVPFATASNKQV